MFASCWFFFFPSGARTRLAASVLSGNNVLQLAYLLQQRGSEKDDVGGGGERRTEERGRHPSRPDHFPGKSLRRDD